MTNEVLKAIFERNSCRDFTGAPLTDEQLNTIIDVALAAPSAMNRMPWHVVVVKDKALVDELDAEGMKVLAGADDKAAFDRMKDRGGKLLYNAPCLLYILGDGSAFASMDSGILTENVCIAAQSMGLSTCIVGMAGVPLNGPNGDALKKRMKFPDGYQFAIGILVGEPKTGKEPHEFDKSKVTIV